ncbi:MAG TPA: two-component regulator propeller domain-containing protein [Bryobacteraceae bacterium]|nr:two-component regulator propeller domain-containing protein [Bryobacteraceae bacterium]
MFLRMFFVCALFFRAQFPASAQIAVDSWTADNGLPQNIIRAICQTPDGYLWLATFDGLVRFDGVRFTTFNRSNTPGIDGNRFGSLFCTADGDIWAGTELGGVTQYHRGRFTTYTMPDGLPSNEVNGVSGDGRGNLWVLAHGFLTQWHAASRRFIVSTPGEDRYSDSLTPDGRAGFWRIEKNTLHRFVHGQESQYALPAGWHNDGLAPDAGVDLNGNIWVASGTGDFARLIDGRWSSILRRRNGISAASAQNAFTTDYRDSLGNVWHCEIVWHSGAGVVQYMNLPPGTQPARIAFNTLFEDREGNIWLSTDGQGLYRVRTQTIHVFSKDHGLPDSNVYPIYQSRDETIWIGTWTAGLTQVRDGKFKTYTTADGLASNRVTAIAEDRDGVLWVAVYNGLHRMRNGRFDSVSINGIVSGHSDSAIRVIHQDPAGVMWAGSTGGLFRLDRGRWKGLTKKDGLATDDARVILSGRDGTLWVGGYGGLSSIRNGQVRSWTEQDGLPSNTVRALYEDARGVLWIGTYDGGLGRFENGRFTKYTVREGLFSDGVFQILEDSRGNLWMSSNQGIYRVGKKQLDDFAAGKTRTITSIQYGKRDGMRNIECNGGLWPAGCKTRDGRLLFPTQDGVAVVDPEKLAANPKPPPVVIESVLIDRAPVSIDRPVRVTPGRENLEIRYTALSLIDSERIRFRYKIQGVDRDWMDSGTRRTAYYPHLPSGSYTFEVTAAQSDGVWNEAGANLAFVVLPPFYQTWWFTVLWSAAGAASLWFGLRYRLGQVERARVMQQAFSRQLIASQENERKRIAAELHDSLGQRLVIIQNQALLLLQIRAGVSGLNGSQRERVEEISAEASGAVREVKELSYNLRPYRLDQLGLTAALRAMIDTAAAASQTAFSVEIDEIDDVFPKESEINFYRIVQECINNILKHSQAAEASIRIRRTKELLTLTVRDDGKGFAPDSARAGSLGGFGLTGISERAQLLGGRALIYSALGHGTTVTIEIHSELSHDR